MGFIDSYKVVFELENHLGKQRRETHRNISLVEFEILYGTYDENIIGIELKQENNIKRGQKNVKNTNN